MFGLSDADRARLDNAAQAGATALTRLQSHEERCTERYGELNGVLREIRRDREADLKAANASRSRLMWMLIAALLGIATTIIKDLTAHGIVHP